jgi:hypothetical protein
MPTPQQQAEAGRKAADAIRAAQADPRGITAESLAPILKKLDEAGEDSPDAKKIADDLRVVQAQTGGISPYHLDPIVVESDEMAKTLAEAAPPAGEAPTVVDVPHLSQEGSVLTCTMGNWTGEPGAYSYQWLSDGTGIGTGTDLNTYSVTGADVGHSITCTVTATNGFGTASSTSNAVVVA